MAAKPLFLLRIHETDWISLGESRTLWAKQNQRSIKEGGGRTRGGINKSHKEKKIVSDIITASSSDIITASSSTIKCIQITDASLRPNGQLKTRLSTSFQHLPEVPTAKKPRCQLHRWARDGSETEVFQELSHVQCVE